jgi:hypothetical protein
LAKSSSRDPKYVGGGDMRISRVSAGFVLVGISIFLFFSTLLAEDSELRVAELAFVENSLALLAAVLMGFGIYLVVFSKACPICAEKVTRAASDCHSCGHVFKSSTHLPDQRARIKELR